MNPGYEGVHIFENDFSGADRWFLGAVEERCSYAGRDDVRKMPG